MSRYILDLTACDAVPEYFGDLKLIPCVDGIHQHDFDIIMDKLPKKLINKVSKLKINQQSTINMTLPIGFSLQAIPSGAKLVKL